MKRVIPLLAVVVLVVGASMAAASIPNANGEIEGCYHEKTGDVRVIDVEDGENRRPQQIAVVWNEQGPQGPQGPAGPAAEPYTVIEDKPRGGEVGWRVRAVESPTNALGQGPDGAWQLRVFATCLDLTP